MYPLLKMTAIMGKKSKTFTYSKPLQCVNVRISAVWRENYYFSLNSKLYCRIDLYSNLVPWAFNDNILFSILSNETNIQPFLLYPRLASSFWDSSWQTDWHPTWLTQASNLPFFPCTSWSGCLIRNGAGAAWMTRRFVGNRISTICYTFQPFGGSLVFTKIM